MPGYSLRNLSEVEDAAAARGVTGIEARFVRDALDCRQHALSVQRLDPGVRQPFGHRHREQEELYVVIDGTGRVKLDEEVVDLRPRDVLRVAPEVTRAFEAGPDGLELIAIGDSGLGDAEMLPDFWPR